MELQTKKLLYDIEQAVALIVEFTAGMEFEDYATSALLRSATVAPVKQTKRIKLANEPFIGMWRDRDDMQDIALWVRNLQHSKQ